MDIGWVGLGKLGLPCAAVLADAGHNVYGYDTNPQIVEYLRGESDLPYTEPGLDRLNLEDLHTVGSVEEVVDHSGVVFIAVQTPHPPGYGGETPTPPATADFEYGYLVQAVRDVAAAAYSLQCPIKVVVVSTVLPGTTDRLLRPLLNGYTRLVYSPQFIAMGTTIRDYRRPGFLLLGADDPLDSEPVSIALSKVHSAPRLQCTIAEAEMTKVAYNTFISLKLTWANHLAMLCDTVGVDAGVVTSALAIDTDRIISGSYMSPGMGDGGACHPRDLIALSHLERRADLPNFFGALASMREHHTQWIADLVARWQHQTRLSVVVLGQAYKPSVPLVDGSPAVLLSSLLTQADIEHTTVDPHVYPEDCAPEKVTGRPAVFVVATNHPEFRWYQYPPGSVVIDPWGVIPDRPGVVLVRPGRS